MAGFRIQQFNRLDSTSTKARELALSGVLPWTVVVAKEQRRGYGRKGNAWYSPPGGLYFSIILPKGNIDDLQTLTILAAFSVAKTLKDNFGIEPFIKLPNDVYFHGKKICGILTENIIGATIKSSVMGIGLNTNVAKFPAELRKQTTSLKLELGLTVDNELVLEQIIGQLQNVFKSISQ